MLQAKFILVAITIFFTDVFDVYYSFLLAINVILLVINVVGKPCVVNWVNTMRTVFFSLCLWASICNSISYWGFSSEDAVAPGIMLLVVWAFILLAPILPRLYSNWKDSKIVENTNMPA